MYSTYNVESNFANSQKEHWLYNLAKLLIHHNSPYKILQFGTFLCKKNEINNMQQ